MNSRNLVTGLIALVLIAISSTFIVDERANKIEIAKAVERLWEVRVKKVRTMRYRGKLKRVSMGRMTPNRNFGRSPSFKKAIVQLSEGDHIEFYEAG